MKVDRSCYEQIQADCAIRAKPWREFCANYQRVLISAPETFAAYCEKFRERFLRAR